MSRQVTNQLDKKQNEIQETVFVDDWPLRSNFDSVNQNRERTVTSLGQQVRFRIRLLNLVSTSNKPIRQKTKRNSRNGFWDNLRVASQLRGGILTNICLLYTSPSPRD